MRHSLGILLAKTIHVSYPKMNATSRETFLICNLEYRYVAVSEHNKIISKKLDQIVYNYFIVI